MIWVVKDEGAGEVNWVCFVGFAIEDNEWGVQSRGMLNHYLDGRAQKSNWGQNGRKRPYPTERSPESQKPTIQRKEGNRFSRC